MANYYEKPYQESESSIPTPAVSQILKNLFLNPFNWSARSTRKEFWVSYAATAILDIILTIIAIFTVAPFSSFNNGYSFSSSSALLFLILIILFLLEFG
ncbi:MULTISPECIES: hypothetical protein [Lactobacillus]|uniref:hypothetical protein n=1 Tax=Lactobacillus TaxID=1578 RepID=UPI002492F30A|nr:MULTISPECIES: hypothetical protein [Lactobacillus]